MSTPRSSVPASIPLPFPNAPELSREYLQALPFPEFARCVARLLERIGYRDVKLMGATHSRGRNKHGGLDLQATLPSDLTQALVVAQVKQYRRPVPRAFIDELRGTMLRQGAQQGLIVTTSTFARAAREAASAGQHSLPVRLMDGNELTALLALHKITAGGADGTPAARSQSSREQTRRSGTGGEKHGFPPVASCPILSPRRAPCPEITTVIITVGHADPGDNRASG